MEMFTTQPLTARQRVVLADLAPAEATDCPRMWMAPMDVGSECGTHHSKTLGQLFRRGLAERSERRFRHVDNGYRYRITDAGIATLEREGLWPPTRG